MAHMPRVLQCCPGCARQYDVGALAAGSPLKCSCGVAFSVAPPRAISPRAMCCSRCGGSLRVSSSTCEYCQAEITLEERHLDAICPVCFARMSSDARYCMSCGVRIEMQALAALPSNTRCPRCTNELRSRRVGAESLIECPSCAGLWVDPLLLERVCADVGARKSVRESLVSMPAKRAALEHETVRYIPCPTCGQLMNRKNFGSISGIIIDVCKPHGIWLDHGEFERALAFAEKGGLIEARRREVNELEERKFRASIGDAPMHQGWLEDQQERPWPRPRIGGVLGWLAHELLD